MYAHYMRLVSLKIENFRGVNFEHDFSDHQFVVLTGINGSGKSTIIEILDRLLTKRANQLSESFAMQITGAVANFEVCISAEDKEIEYLAERIAASQPNQAEKEQVLKALRSNIFDSNNNYTHRLEVDKPVLGWNAQGQSVREFINGKLIDNQHGFDSLIAPQAFNVFAQEIVLKFEQLESISLQFSQQGARRYSIRDIFQSNDSNEAARTSRTNVSASPLLDSLVSYKEVDYSKLEELLADYNAALYPIKFELGPETPGSRSIVMKRNDSDTPFTIETASSGQKKAIVLATLKYTWKDSTLKPIVLLDEPENSMHPGLTSNIFKSLDELVELASVQPSFVIATHSPEVVAALPNNTYRIVVENGSSKLEKIVGLESRAKILDELGVHFHLDYVAQKIVFVESIRNRINGELSDETAYQRLIDPHKEEVLFVSVGSNSQTEEKYKFQRILFEELQSSSPNLIHRLKDRDDDEQSDSNTPYKHIEYLYVVSNEVLAEVLSVVLAKQVLVSEVRQFKSKSDVASLLSAEDYKEVWKKLVSEYRIRGKSKGVVQGMIVDTFNKHPGKRTAEIEQLISRYRS